METAKSSTMMDWILFLVTLVIFIALLAFKAEWSWLALPFWTTYLVKALKVI